MGAIKNMNLSSDLISKFVDVMHTDNKQKVDTGPIYGTVVERDGSRYVKLDGSDSLTPVVSTVDVKDGERVLVNIVKHSATVIGNMSSPAARTDSVDEVADSVLEVSKLVADKASIKDFQAQKGRIDTLMADNVTIHEKITASEGEISNLKTDNVTVKEKITANEADIKQIKTDKLDASTAELRYATITNLDATNGQINNLSATHSNFVNATVENFKAVNADIEKLNTKKLDAESADIKFANIDFSNIGKAAMEYFYAQSGLIKDVVVGDQKITGHLIGVTISGDLIEGNTVKAEKLVVLGEDGLYYKLNVNALGETVASSDAKYQNGLDGSVIIAKSVTAEKVSVKDLVAFGATIGGLNITDGSLYSGVKDSIDNTTQGFYVDKNGQLYLGDAENFLRYYKAKDGTYKLAISAKSVTFGSSQNLEEAWKETKTSIESKIETVDVEYYLSTSATTLSGGSWSTTAPAWTDGKYMWMRTKITDGTHNVTYSPDENGTCIAGATGATGSSGKGIASIVEEYYQSTSATTLSGGSWSTTPPTWTDGKYIWTRSVITYTDTTVKTTEGICTTGQKGDTGAQGPQGNTGPQGEKGATGDRGPQGVQGDTGDRGPQGIQGEKGEKGDTGAQGPQGIKGDTGPQGPQGIQGPQGVQGAKGTDGKTYYTWIKYADSPTSGMSDSPAGKLYLGVAYNKSTATESTNYSDYSWSLIKGEKGDRGATGATGPKGADGASGATGNGIKSITYTYARTTSQTAPAASTITSTTIPTLDATNKYLWQKEVITYTNNQNQTTVLLLAVYGDRGAKGDKGATGERGPTGATGPQGIKGDIGPQGPQGDTGARGPQGAQGDTGPRGPQGPQGAQGATGPRGPQGEKGEDGLNGTNLWINPLFDADKPQITTLVNGVTAPNGSKVNIIKDRDHYNNSTSFPVFPDHTYTIYVDRKRISGDSELHASIWYTEQSSGNAYDSYNISPRYTSAISGGWEKAVYDVTVPRGKRKGCVYFQIEQGTNGATKWYVANISCIDVTAISEAKQEAARTATNFMRYEDGTGLIVGDMRGDTLGQNTLLDSSGMAVRKGNDEIVRFGTGKIVIPNDIGEVQYNGNGSIMSSKDNIVVSTQQTKNSSDTNKGGKSALEMYYDRDSDVMGLALSIKKGTSYSDLYESEGRGLFMEYGTYDSSPEAKVSLLGDHTTVEGTNAFVSGDEYVRIESSGSNGKIHCQSPNIDYVLGKNTILWDANTIGYWMNAGHKITLNQPISKQLTGAVFVWSHYSNKACDNWWWTSFFVPKQHVAWRPGDGMLMCNPYYGLNKYIYIGDTFIQGADVNQSNNAQNGIGVNNQGFVLRYVLGV